jgi:predicted transcriptional regulator
MLKMLSPSALAEIQECINPKQIDAISQMIVQDTATALRRLAAIEQTGAIKKTSELTADGYYWYRVKPSRQWKILHITDPQRLSYGIDSFEFSGPIPAPAE